MAHDSTNYQCLACNGALKFSSETGNLECEYCGSSFTVAQIEQAYAERQAKADAAAQQPVSQDQAAWDAAGAPGGEVPLGSDGQPMRVYTCSSCGAELVCEQTTAITECPYCGNQAVVPGVLVGDFKPDLVIPFKLDKNAATTALKQYYKGKKFLPKEFVDNNRIEKIQGVYVPFWLYNAEVSASASFDATRVRIYREGDDQVTETRHYDVTRSGTMEFSRVPVDGSSKMPDGHMDAIEPFDYHDLVPFSVAYLPGFAADRFDQDEDFCKGRAQRRMESTMESELMSTVTGYDGVSTRGCSSEASWKSSEYAMLPVWMLHTTWKDKGFLFAMNGQTGKLIGNLPVSAPKFIAWFLGIFLIVGALAAALMLGVDFFEDTATNVGVAAAVGAVISGIVCGIFWSEMKTAVEKSEANAFMQRETFCLTGGDDSFSHITRTRVRINTDRDK